MPSQGLGQTLLLTQQLTVQQMQYLRLLQMNTLELNTYLSELQLENPLLELSAPAVSVSPEETSAADLARWACAAAPTYQAPDPNDGDDAPSFEEMQPDESGRDSLEEYLKSQIDLSVDGEEYRMLDYLIGSLDKNGYLSVTAQQLAAKFGCDLSLAQEAIGYLQTLDPPGVGAADLGECLQIQLLRLGIASDDAMRLCSDWLEEMAHGHFQKAARALGVSVDRVISLYSVIRTLDPRPASSFDGGETAILIPDVTVLEDGGLSCRYNRQYSASLTVNRDYLSLGQEDSSAKEYLNRKMSQALWVVRAVQSRQETIEKIVDVILEEQKPFFTQENGPLRPLRLKDVATRLGVHESTVSRAVNEKYLQCRRGVFPLKHFFPAAVHSSTDEDSSNSDVKETLRALIAGEDTNKPLSDSALCRLLDARGIRIARRTVAKYREEMGIPSSATRGK